MHVNTSVDLKPMSDLAALQWFDCATNILDRSSSFCSKRVRANARFTPHSHPLEGRSLLQIVLDVRGPMMLAIENSPYDKRDGVALQPAGLEDIVVARQEAVVV